MSGKISSNLFYKSEIRSCTTFLVLFVKYLFSSLVRTGNQELESIIERGHTSMFSDDEGNLDENTSSDESVGYVQLLSMFQFMILIVKGRVV